MRKRDCWRFFDYRAECEVCGWESAAKNALGNAARHYNATGHPVQIEIYGNVYYCSPEKSEEIRQYKAELKREMERRGHD